jgi:peptide chain release factor 1
MFDKLIGIENRYHELERLLSDPKIIQDYELYQKYAREHSDLGKIVKVFKVYQTVSVEIDESLELLKDDDPEISNLARDEIDRLNEEKAHLEEELKKLLIPKDPLDGKNVIIEIRAGTGGEEAGLFASDIFQMYQRFAEIANWKVEILNHHATGVGGLKEVIAIVKGQNAYSRLKYESGTHRVQRVPATETQGRVHTSAVTVAVLPEAEAVDIDIEPNEIKVDVYRATGPGGQSVNTTDSAVRLTHLPTGLVVTCQDEKSQHKNKAKAMKVLSARLLDAKIQEQNDKRSEERKSMVGTGDRSERIRTYNYPQGRVTDHRIGLTLYKLDSILQGNITEIVDELTTYYQAQALKNEQSDDTTGQTVDHS